VSRGLNQLFSLVYLRVISKIALQSATKLKVAKKIIQTVEDRGVVQPIRKDDLTHVTRFNQSQNIALT
jgi:ribosomal protein S25